jgi:predicted dehydrogenase
MAGEIGLASIGLGRWGALLAERVMAGEGARIVSCFARTREQRQTFSERFGCEAAESIEELLGTPKVAGVLIATSHTSHLQLIEAAASAGKHVFVEKPLTLTLADARAAVAATESAGVHLQVGHQRRRSAANRQIKSMLDEGILGEVQLMESVHTSSNGLKWPADAWRRRPEESPLGSMTSLAVHTFDTFMYFGGPIRRIFTATRAPRATMPIDEATALTVEFESGVLGAITTSFYVLDLVRLSVMGSAAAAFNEDDSKKLSIMRRDAAREPVELETNDPVADQIDEFVAAIAGETTPEVGGREGMAVVAALEAAVKSSQTGQAVELD